MGAKWERPAKIGLLLLGADRFRVIGEGTPGGSYAQRQERAAQELKARAGELGEVVFPGICYEPAGMRRAMSLFYTSDVDYVLAAHLSWTEDAAWVHFLRDMPETPILFASLTRERVDIQNTYDDDSFCRLLVSNGLVGTLEASGSIRRFGRRMVRTVAGTLEEVMAEARVFGDAARARNVLRASHFGLFGPYNEVMWSTYVDPYKLFMDVGPEIHFYSLPQLTALLETVTEADTLRVSKRLLESYPVDSGNPFDEKKFHASVKASIAFDRLCAQAGVDVMVMNDIDNVLLRTLGLRPGFLWASGENPATVVPEGDIGSGIAAYLLKLFSRQQVSYLEPFYVERDRQQMVVAHGGPNDYRDPRGKCLIGSDMRYAKSDLKYAGAPIAWYRFPAGDMTLLHVSQVGEAFKMAMGSVESIDCPHFMTSYSHGRIRPKQGTCEELIGKLMRIGVTQHFGMTPGNCLPQLEAFAEIMGFEAHSLNP